MVRMTKIYFDTKFTLELFVPSEEQIVVGCTSLPLGISFLDPFRRSMHHSDAHRIYWLKKSGTKLSVGNDKRDAFSTSSGHNEVELGISKSFSVVDMLGSFVDEGPTVEGSFVFSLPSCFLFSLELGLDLSSIRAFDISVDAFF